MKLDLGESLGVSLRGSLGHGSRVWPGGKEGGCDAVYLVIGALSGQYDGAQEFKAATVVKEGDGPGPEGPEDFKDGGKSFWEGKRAFHGVMIASFHDFCD